MDYNLFMKIVGIMGAVGIPSIFSMTMWCIKACKKYTKQLKILMKSQQAQMRTKLLEKYHEYKKRGWVSEEELEDWENQYQSYHDLGQNGILDKRREVLMSLPNAEN